MKDEDIEYGKWKQAKIERDWHNLPIVPQFHQKVGTKVPFSRTVDKDPWKDIPLSVPVEHPRAIEAAAWAIIATAVGLVYWWVS